MGHVVVKQPNGLFALWSSVVDDFHMIDATREEVVEFEMKRVIEAGLKTWHEAMDRAEKTGTSSRQEPNTTYADLCEIVELRNEVHKKGEVG